MATNLTALVDVVDNKVNGPTDAKYVVATEEGWVTSLINGFWTARAAGLLTGYREDGGAVYLVGDDDAEMPRLDQQLVVLWTAVQVVRAKILADPTMFSGSAAPGTNMEVQFSATLRKALLDGLEQELAQLRDDYSELGDEYRTTVSVLDGLGARVGSYASGAMYVGP